MGKPRPVKEGDKWRLKIQAGDGGAHSVHIQLPDRAQLNGSYIRYVAEQLFVEVDDLDSVLADWSPDQLREHLESQGPDALRSNVFGKKN